MAQLCELPRVSCTARETVPSSREPEPRSTAGRASPMVACARPRCAPSPRPKAPPAPQQNTSPYGDKTQVCASPRDASAAWPSAPKLTCGRLSPIVAAVSPRARSSSYPSCPSWFLPQHLSSPPWPTAHVCSPPARTTCAIMREPVSGAGACCRRQAVVSHQPDAWRSHRSWCAGPWDWADVCPRATGACAPASILCSARAVPHWPWSLAPQQNTRPWASRAQVCAPPADAPPSWRAGGGRAAWP
mmetsp:Transcript_16648/g.51219  ORF Transcript_16648/g.51219 Transcript_16648/m.51219 type:complete len:245 (-) Transcript_16648:247-981(-)